MQVNSIFKSAKIDNSFLPTPSYFCEGCGMSIRINFNNFERARDLLNKSIESSKIKFYKAIKNCEYKFSYKALE